MSDSRGASPRGLRPRDVTPVSRTPTSSPVSPPIGRALQSYVRVRPYLPKEGDQYPPGYRMQRNVVEVYDDRNVSLLDHTASFRPRQSFNVNTLWSVEPDAVTDMGPDDVRHTYVAQDELFEKVGRPMLRHVVEGLHTTFMTYGQAGSGKTYSMVGDWDDDIGSGWSQAGVLPRFCEEVFLALYERKREYSTAEVDLSIDITAVEVFMEKFSDLLCPKRTATPTSSETIRIREDPDQGVFLQNATTITVTNKEDLCDVLRKAVRMAERSPNRSQAHSVFILNVNQKLNFDDGSSVSKKTINSRVIFADLGGSERKAGESIKSQKALVALRRCVDLAAQEGATNQHPVRDSVLTHLLGDVVKGTCETTLVACVSPFFKHANETLATLQFATTMQFIPVIAKPNEDAETSSLRRFDAEIKGLDVELLNANKSMEAVRQELEMRQIRLNDLQEVKEEQEMMLEAAEGDLTNEKTAHRVVSLRAKNSRSAAQMSLNNVNQRLDGLAKETAAAERTHDDLTAQRQRLAQEATHAEAARVVAAEELALVKAQHAAAQRHREAALHDVTREVKELEALVAERNDTATTLMSKSTRQKDHAAQQAELQQLRAAHAEADATMRAEYAQQERAFAELDGRYQKAAAEGAAEEVAVRHKGGEADALEKEVAALRAEVHKMEQDILLYKPPGCCAVS